MSTPFTPEQEARVREIVREMTSVDLNEMRARISFADARDEATLRDMVQRDAAKRADPISRFVDDSIARAVLTPSDRIAGIAVDPDTGRVSVNVGQPAQPTQTPAGSEKS